MSRPSLVAVYVLVGTIVVVSRASGPIFVHAQSATDFVPVTDAMLQDPAPGDWLMWRRTLDGWGYSPLDQVTRENVRALRMVWSSEALTTGSGEGAPLAYDGVLYVPQTSRCHPRDRCRDRRPEVGVSPRCAG